MKKERTVVRRLVAAMFVVLACATLGSGAGCGAASSMGRRPEPRLEQQRDAQGELDYQEARLREAHDELETLDPAACPDRCRSAGSICDASSRICAIAQDLGDEATASRCERAEATCREAHEATSACGCEPAPVDAGTV